MAAAVSSPCLAWALEWQLSLHLHLCLLTGGPPLLLASLELHPVGARLTQTLPLDSQRVLLRLVLVQQRHPHLRLRL